jgi:hypothetical protein
LKFHDKKIKYTKLKGSSKKERRPKRVVRKKMKKLGMKKREERKRI